MSEATKISNLKSISSIQNVINKLFLSQHLDNAEKQFVLSLAIVLIKQYQKDKSYKISFELAYFIILKYSILFHDWQPLYDLSVNFGFYPISNAIINNKGIISDITTETLTVATETFFGNDGIIETKEQNISRKELLSTDQSYVSYIAPTSFGKSKLIIEHIKEHINPYSKIAVIVPTKSLLMQTYRNIKKAFPRIRVLIHDEMYSESDNCFISVFTQERALRLLEKYNSLYFDILYVDEAHKLLENTDRSILLARLIRLVKHRNNCAKMLYLSPLVQDSKNISLSDQEIREYKIAFNIKVPIVYEYAENGDVFIYNRFFNDLIKDTHFDGDYLQYIENKATDKNFIYLYTPRKIEHFAKTLFEAISQEIDCPEILQVIESLNKHVHKDFYVSKYLQKGIIYIHGKLPDDIKDYLEFKFNRIPQIKYLIANNVILEGVNLPFDSLFIVNSRNLNKNSLVNLIGRVNRLNMVFTNSIDDLSKLMPKVHFVENHGEFCTCSMKNKIKLLKTSDFQDDIQNPLLDNFNIENKKIEEKIVLEEIINNENFVFQETDNNILLLKQNMLKLSMNTIYNFSNDLCSEIWLRISKYKERYGTLSDQRYVFDLLNYVFINQLNALINDDEFKRLDNEISRNYYHKLIVKHRKLSLKEKISLTARYLYRIKRLSTNPFLYVGSSYGECDDRGNISGYNSFYVNLRLKDYSYIVNLSIIKIKLEDDFVSFKLNKFFQLMLDYELISQQLYNDLVYGTNDPLILSLSKLGLSMHVINKLVKDEQLCNLSIDEYKNLTYNEKFLEYKNASDDFFRFELNKFLP